ncbi:glutathione S-transferase T1-like [Chenopodium quinoa]|uniref:glutathione S-transferase T1-like n=1 Tax=Chenopodium quinoa TaxID=63459 RepID=UPI000B76BA2C|nr:glutathione S-transferase T1-like [Chenopodium quinoa]
MATELLKIYGDRKSQPTRAILIFCKANGIQFEEVKIRLFTSDVQTPEYQAIHPLKKVPAIADGDFTLFESHAILTYLACWYQVPDHWYPADLRKRAKVQSVLDWHQTTLRYGSTRYLINTVLAPTFGKTPNPQVAAEYEQILVQSLSTVETLWLKGDAKFLLGNDQPSVADLALVCEIMQLHVLDEKDRARILSPYKKVQEWIEATKASTQPHFDDVHGILYKAKIKFQKQREIATLQSKM